MTRIGKLVRDYKVHVRAGLNGNWYVFGRMKGDLEKVCDYIGKSPYSIYYNKRHECFTIRIREKRTVERLKARLPFL
jgi:hypothetical protein